METSERKFKTYVGTTRRVKEIILLDNLGLRVKSDVWKYEVTFEILPKGQPQRVIARKGKGIEEEIKVFHLRKVTVQELAELRKKKVPSFVLKVNGELLYSEIPKNMALTGFTLFGRHLCGVGCKCVSPGVDSEKWCKKVQEGSTGIEKYPWITKGYETFATYTECFVVIKCKHFKPF